MKVCNEPGCPNLRPCPKPGHERKPWGEGRNGTTSRRQRGVTLSGWKEQARNKATIKRYGGRCYLCGQPAQEVDHIDPLFESHDDTERNRAAICRSCHRAKSQAEATRARQRSTT